MVDVSKIDITTLRARLQWSQSDLGQCVGCDQSTINRIEAGRQPPNGSAARLLERLQILIDDGRVSPKMSVADVVDLLVGRGEAPILAPIAASA